MILEEMLSKLGALLAILYTVLQYMFKKPITIDVWDVRLHRPIDKVVDITIGVGGLEFDCWDSQIGRTVTNPALFLRSCGTLR